MSNHAGSADIGQIAIGAPSLPDSIKRLLPWVVAIAYFMESLDTTILNTAVPIIARAMGVEALSMKSVLASYTLSLAIFIPASGWMADRFGTRVVFSSAIALFTLASFLCGLTNNLYVLIACRILQGCGGAMMVPVGRLVLVRAFDKSDIIRVLSFVTIFGWVGPVLGPTLGGIIVGHLSWRFIFWVNLPIGITGLALVLKYLPNYREGDVKPFDLTGFILFGSGIAILSYVLEIFGDHAIASRYAVVLLVISGVLLTGYGWHSLHTPYPLLQTTLFRIRTFAVSVTGSFLTRLGVGGVSFLLPLLYQLALGYSPMQSGLLIMPQALGGIAAKIFLPRILEWVGYRHLLIANTTIVGLLLMCFAMLRPGTPVWMIVLLATFYGAATSLQYTTMNTMAYSDIDDRKTSGAGSIASTVQELSISFGIAASGLLAAFFVSGQTGAHPMRMMLGLHEAFIVLGVFTMLCTLVFARLKDCDGDGLTQHSHFHHRRGYR